ncbi:MAG: lysylphosphatidylglycerol synthase transmembrane domain-containing protein, partial [Pseudonocardiaceae bacterium]
MDSSREPGAESDVAGDTPASLLERAGTAAAGISSAGGETKRGRLLVQYGLAVLIFGFLLLFVARQWNQLPNFDWRFSPGWLAVSVVCVALFYALQGELWRVVIHSLGEHIDATPGRAVWGKSLIARYVPTNVLMVVGRVVMAERHGVPKRVTLASVVYELALAVGTAVMVGAYFVIELPELEGQPARYALLALIPAVLVVVHPRVFRPLAAFALGKLGREPLPRVVPFGRVLQLCLAYTACWATIGLGLYAFAAALHPVDLSDLPYIASSYPVAFCVAVVTFIVPSGIGTRDAALATALAVVLAGTV